jgi:hypothetical protein
VGTLRDISGRGIKAACAGGTQQLISSNSIVVGKNNGLWCPAAKVGTSTIYNYMEHVLLKSNTHPLTRCIESQNPLKAGYIGKLTLHNKCVQVKAADSCGLFSFTFVRNPWDRVYSAWKGKRHTIASIKGMSFPQFVRYIAKHPTQNIHWEPYSARCFLPGITYDYVGKLENQTYPFNDQIHDIYSKIHFVNAEKGAVKTMNVRKANAAKGGVSTGKTISLDRIRERVQRMKTRRAAYLEIKGLRSPMELVESVARTYATDIKRFGYSFGCLDGEVRVDEGGWRGCH